MRNLLGRINGWGSVAGVLALVGATALIGVLFLGGSVSAILSTVGSSIPGGAFAPGARPAAGGGSTGGDLVGGGPWSGGSGGGASGGSSGGQQLYDPAEPDLQIIKTGTLDLQVTVIDDALAAATAKIQAVGGYASGSQRSGDGDKATASVTYRIPAARWDDALVALRAIGTKVIAEQAKTEDVTGQIVDLGARITNLEATEAALQAIILKASKIPDVLEVQSQLTDVRGQIEQLTGQQKHLQEQAAYSTLTVTYSLKAPQAVVTTAKGFDPADVVDQASARFVHILQRVATAGIWFGIVWLPILLALGIVTAVVIFVLRRFGGVGSRGSAGPGGSRGDLAAAGPIEG